MVRNSRKKSWIPQLIRWSTTYLIWRANINSKGSAIQASAIYNLQLSIVNLHRTGGNWFVFDGLEVHRLIPHELAGFDLVVENLSAQLPSKASRSVMQRTASVVRIVNLASCTDIEISQSEDCTSVARIFCQNAGQAWEQ